MSIIVLLDPKLTHMSNSAIFKQKKKFFNFKIFGASNEKRAAAAPLIDQFCIIWSERVLRIERIESHHVWASWSNRFLIGSCESFVIRVSEPLSPGPNRVKQETTNTRLISLYSPTKTKRIFSLQSTTKQSRQSRKSCDY